MEFTCPVAWRTRLQKGKMSTASSSRGLERKKGGTFPSETKATKASSSAAKKSRHPAGVARPGSRGKRRNRSKDRDYEVISLGDTDSDYVDGLDVGFGSDGSTDLRAGAGRDREMQNRRRGGEEDDYSVISLGPSSSDDEEGPPKGGEERLPETDSGFKENKTSDEIDAEDSNDECFGLSSEGEEKEEEENGGTESRDEIVRQCEKAGKERKRGRPRAQQKETAGSSRKGGLQYYGSHSSPKVEVNDVEMISLGLSDGDDMDDVPDVFARVEVPGAVASRTRSKAGPRMSTRGATGPGHTPFPSSHWKLREKEIALSPPTKKAPTMKKGEGKRKSERDSGCSDHPWKKNGEARDSGALSSSKGPPKKQKTVVEGRRAPARKRISRESDFLEILAESIWKKDGKIGDGSQDEQQVRELLPVKFPWFDDEKRVEESEYVKEMEDLWKMMNLGLKADQIGSYSPRNEDTDADDTELETSQTALCRQGKHVLILDEQIGQRCRYCSHIAVEIDGYYAPFDNFPSETQHRGYYRDKDAATLDSLQFQAPKDCSADYFGPTGSGTVWDLIPGTRNQLYPHQKEGFEFMWRNLAGSIILDELRNRSLQKHKDVGGCIISHAPGTGKTRLTLVFLQAYLELFPDSHPVIIAPSSLLLTWEDEKKKWGVGVPFHNLNGKLSGKEDIEAVKMLDSHRLSRNIDSIRMVKLYSWSKSKSILVVSYEMFAKLTKESARIEQMRKILLELPGLVILDEGHTPRNRESDVWNQIMRLKTKKRVSLSGTPFQNNFDELHNTLYVVRPKIAESIPPHLKRFCKRGTSTYIDGNPDEGINEIKAIMAPFVHLHKGDILQKNLPGLRDTVVVLNPSELQLDVLRSIQGADDTETAKRKRKDNVFDFEHKQALISVHPSLVLSLKAEERSVISREEEKLERHKLNPSEGVKTRFLVEFLRLCLTMGEKVLVFSQYIDPLDSIALQLSSVFKWTKGREVLMMTGKLSMNQRQPIINLFNDPDSEARVLLASIRACAEGINLVGASRIILLDVVWNPSKEKQAISRAYRLGQKRVVYTYHLIMKGTSEWEKYQKQAHKDRLSELVFTATTSNGDKNEKKLGVVFYDKILEEMTSHPKLRDLFHQIRYQPKQMDLVENFGPNI
ncbi:SNF2 domain-containing protein CLASSY 3-like [Punica granatum]|uniref:SNF2 domain-containing protein CLASSY 3-like n=1 Tax=Punica granatum TaxID=22663 RepID=A0A6P8D6H6_PUNGR|nr:SNF2 domain-containing protein CLASSY 3-like [Punica granatum]